MSLSRLLLCLLILYSVERIVSLVEFTNIQCTSLGEDFADFEYCVLKSVNRSFKYISLKVKLFKLPITKIKVNFALLKRYSGYKPFLYNITVDACKVIKNPKYNPVMDFFYSCFKDFSNMNHTCPFDHDIILEKLPIAYVNTKFTAVLPFPVGDYLFQTSWIAYDVNRANVNVYFTLS
ncbi:uncharacterized protein LOC108113914 [Drosophila eugracilis]|uniref:uncharacterized protein LOC108113914 n=1 Tax=Drosophila eugracilis TaxID=29029 RepID=UPI0007E77B59|nr:uncharacterized protein LOC108113914 [Drosophila eugracilis]